MILFMDKNTISRQRKQPIISLLNKIDLYNNKLKYEVTGGTAI